MYFSLLTFPNSSLRDWQSQEIILHTLFESGTTRIGELERYIRVDVVRYGTRLTDLEKKLATAYGEAFLVSQVSQVQIQRRQARLLWPAGCVRRTASAEGQGGALERRGHRIP